MIAVLGAGPHGRQVAAVLSGACHVVELYDDALDGYQPVLEGAVRRRWVIGAAWPQVRRAVAERLAGASTEAPWREGRVAYPGVRIGHDVTWGAHTHVQWDVVLCHGVRLGDFVTVAPGVVLSGDVAVGAGVFLGAHATVIHGGITIGDGAMVGAGSVVVDDVPAGEVWAGNPARRIADAWDHRDMAAGRRRRARLAAPG